MINTLNIPKLAKNMSLEDKIRLLFADSNLQAETGGKENVLQPFERDLIIDQARKNNEIKVLQLASNIHKTGQFMIIQLEIDHLKFLLGLTRLEGFITGTMLKFQAGDIINEILYEITRQYPNFEESKIEEVRKKYWDKDKMLASFSYFPSSENAEEGIPNVLEPNENFQNYFMTVFKFARYLNRGIFEFEYLKNKISVNVFAQRQQDEIESYKKELKEFIDLDWMLKPLRMFRDLDFKWLKDKNSSDIPFISTIKDLAKVIDLSEEEKEKYRNRVDNSLSQ